jgi:hypothetical protein
MIRRCLLAVAGLSLSLALSAGCGPILRSAEKVDVVLRKAEMALMPNRLEYTVYQPSHRVALATLDVLKAELAKVEIHDIELSQDNHFNPPDGKKPGPGDVRIPDDYPAFWIDGLSPIGPVLVNCRSVDFEGQTKDGMAVVASVRLEIVATDQRTVVSVQVGRRGDTKPTEALIDKISAKVLEPTYKPGSPEERAALNAAFAPRLGTDEEKFLDDGDIRIKKK